jgi:hypothetical protein
MKTAKSIPPLTKNKFIKQFLVGDSFGDIGIRLGEINEKRLSTSHIHTPTSTKKKSVKLNKKSST